MNECCANCAHCYSLTKFDFSGIGCIHTPMEGFVCMAFQDEGMAIWQVGQPPEKMMCEGFTEKGRSHG